MKMKELFDRGEFAVSAEVGPPKGIHVDELVEEAKTYLTGVHAVNVTDNQSSVMRLGSLAMCKVLKDAGMDPIFQLGKSSLTPENTQAIVEALEARELIKINVLQNCADDPNELAQIVAERTHSQVVQVIGKKIVLYKESKNKKKIELPPANKKN